MTKQRVPSWAPDVDHELSQIIAIHRVFREPGYARKYPIAIRRALRVAYSAHFRALMEFFHDGRPSDSDWNRVGKEKESDVKYSRLTGAGANPFARKWTKRELRRFSDADKLTAHLSDQRSSRRGAKSEWGADPDWALLTPLLQDFVKRTRTLASHFPKTLGAARGLGLV